MIYLVDANNLAGQLGILHEPDFDIRLVLLWNQFLSAKDARSSARLVFDGYDSMGEKYQSGRVIVVRAPIDSRIRTADDKVVEQAMLLSGDKSQSVTVVTNDLGISERLRSLGLFERNNISWVKASDFADRLIYVDDGELNEKDDFPDVTRELMDLWK